MRVRRPATFHRAGSAASRCGLGPFVPRLQVAISSAVRAPGFTTVPVPLLGT